MRVHVLKSCLLPQLEADIATRLRLIYTLGPSPASTELKPLIIMELSALIDRLVFEQIGSDITRHATSQLASSAGVALQDVDGVLRRLAKESIERCRQEQTDGVWGLAANMSETILSRLEDAETRLRESQAQRTTGEGVMRDRVVHLTKALDELRASTYELRLLYQTLVRRVSGLGSSVGQRLPSTATAQSPRSATQRTASGPEKSTKTAHLASRARHYEPLGPEQLRSLYNGAVHRTSVEELPKEELDALARKHGGNAAFIPVQAVKTVTNRPSGAVRSEFTQNEHEILKELRRLRARAVRL